MIDKPAPQWKLPSLTGDSVSLSELKGKFILLEFWFPRCGSCLAAVPHISEIANTYKEKGLEVYGIEFKEYEKDKLMDYVIENKINIPTLYNGEDVAVAYSVMAAPTFFLIDRSGKIVNMQNGWGKQKLIDAIEKNLK